MLDESKQKRKAYKKTKKTGGESAGKDKGSKKIEIKSQTKERENKVRK